MLLYSPISTYRLPTSKPVFVFAVSAIFNKSLSKEYFLNSRFASNIADISEAVSISVSVNVIVISLYSPFVDNTNDWVEVRPFTAVISVVVAVLSYATGFGMLHSTGKSESLVIFKFI
ncbi:MAG: hypothetical protein E7376_05145, partial [Clostridiales bacterium]|nr:hypothetical protein [Clostridiales bacterium]